MLKAYKFNKLLLLSDLLVEKAEKSTIQPANPIKPKNVPVKAIKAWKSEGGKLEKEFKFFDVESRNRFVFRLLSYEEEKGHSGTIVIDENNVSISVTTRDLGKITELDKEYSRDVDAIYSELVK